MKTIEEMTNEAFKSNAIPCQSEIDSAVTMLIEEINNDSPGFKADAEEAGCDTYESYARYSMELDDEDNALLFDSAARLWAWTEDGCFVSFKEFADCWTFSY